MAGTVVELIEEQASRIEELETAIREFVARCEAGEVRSVRTYSTFKKLLEPKESATNGR